MEGDSDQGLLQLPGQALRSLTDWKAISDFLHASPNPTESLIFAALVAIILGLIAWKALSVILAYICSKHQKDIELARLGIPPTTHAIISTIAKMFERKTEKKPITATTTPAIATDEGDRA